MLCSINIQYTSIIVIRCLSKSNEETTQLLFRSLILFNVQFSLFEAGTMNPLISQNQSDDNEIVMMKPAAMKIAHQTTMRHLLTFYSALTYHKRN